VCVCMCVCGGGVVMAAGCAFCHSFYKKKSSACN